MHQTSGCKLVDKLSSMRSWWLFVLLINWDLWVSNQVDQLYQVGFLRNLGTMPSPERFIECSRLIWHFEQAFRHVLFQNFQLLFQGMSMVEWVKAQAQHSHIIDHLTVLYDSSIFVHILNPRDALYHINQLCSLNFHFLCKKTSQLFSEATCYMLLRSWGSDGKKSQNRRYMGCWREV
jgi:hypothetical protein